MTENEGLVFAYSRQYDEHFIKTADNRLVGSIARRGEEWVKDLFSHVILTECQMAEIDKYHAMVQDEEPAQTPIQSTERKKSDDHRQTTLGDTK